jgi:hypothetical protein
MCPQTMYYVSLNTDREQIMSEQTNWGIINMDTGDITIRTWRILYT